MPGTNPGMSTLIRRLILALATLAGLAPAFAQSPPPVPALPDTERRTSYSISASTCSCAVGFQLYGDSTDVANWIQVWLNGVQVAASDPSFGWSLSTVTTGGLANAPRPITNAVLTFVLPQTGTVQIVGARRPRRTSQFQESQPVPTRNINQLNTDIIAMEREIWDLRSRLIQGLPSETMNPLPSASARANNYLVFDTNGNPITAPGVTLIQYIASVNYATTAVLANSPVYANGASGVGATLTETGNGALSVDGNAPIVGNRILVLNQASTFQNGIYTVTAAGSGGAPYVLTRTTDFDQTTEMFQGVSALVTGGAANIGTGWTLSASVGTIGTSAVTFYETSLSVPNAAANLSFAQDFVAGIGFTAGVTTSLVTTSTPLNANSTEILFDGIAQSHNTWSLAGSTFTFNVAIPTNVQVVEIQYLSPSYFTNGVQSISGVSGPIQLGSNLVMVGQTLNTVGLGLTGNNLIRNSGLGLTTLVSTVLVNSPSSKVTITSWAQQGGAGSGNVRFSTTGGNQGLKPGKLVAILGPNSASISATCTATLGTTLACGTSVFTQSQGDMLWITGGTNASPRTQYRVVTPTSGSVIVLNGPLLNETSKTYTITALQGGYPGAVDATVDGIPQAGNPFSPAFFYYPLQVTQVGVNFFDAQMAGRNLNVGATQTATAWEVTNGSQNTGCIGPDWWTCTGTLSYYKMRGTDWDGSTVVNRPGSLYSSKLIKGATTQELFYEDLQAAAPSVVGITNYTGLANFQGKTLTCAAYIWAPNANEGRIFINDGLTFTYSSFVTPGSYQWAEVTATLSSAASTAQFGVSMDTGTVGDVFFLTQPICKFGAGVIGVGNYQPAPPTFHMFTGHTNPFYYINASLPGNAFINIEQETSGCIPSGMESVQADIGGANTDSAPRFLQLSDGPGPPQMSALVSVSPTNSAAQSNNQTGQVAISKRGSGDGQFNLDTQWINVNGSVNWTGVTIDYLGGVY